MTRDEHLAWAKKRAHEYVAHGELREAVMSLGSDMRKHPELEATDGGLFLYALIFELQRGPDAVRRWIDGFN